MRYAVQFEVDVECKTQTQTQLTRKDWEFAAAFGAARARKRSDQTDPVGPDQGRVGISQMDSRVGGAEVVNRPTYGDILDIDCFDWFEDTLAQRGKAREVSWRCWACAVTV